ncbi:MAG: esterase [Flavobacteriaceae bacterium CG_4_10_14_3_um_filter_31_253]|nr:MAG: esterase [Flavobacteriaceae bacterium CG_4_10_14_3_um_filter_31_253]PJC09041.1 MAG: esterase [Flavobacteriaceae bacterium CG_4_9_14_0_8_um_filter_31_91]
MKKILIILILLLETKLFAQDLNIEFKILKNNHTQISDLESGRLFIIFQKEKPTSIFSGIPYPDLKMNPVFGIDVSNWKADSSLIVEGKNLYGFPKKNIAELQKGDWYVYALFKNFDSSKSTGEAETIYGSPVLINIKSSNEVQEFQLHLDKILENILQPVDRKHFKYESITSSLLSNFWQMPMNYKFQVALPKSYYLNPEKKYPILVMVGGFGERYYNKIISEKVLMDSNTPEMIVILLDSKAPFGDSYQVNSANNGPYGDALVTEVIPYIESKYRCIGDATSRFLTGTSTGGWSSLALQIFYPDFFNGVWSTCADPVDFRQMELINIYEDKNAFINRHGIERPAMRDINGEPRYTLKTEVWAENILGANNSYHRSGGQWGSWNAVFSPKDSLTGMPKMIFDPETGKIDSNVAEAWKKYDLRLYLHNNWKNVGSKLDGKLHIWMGTADSYYLNNAMLLFDRFMKSTSNPKSDAEINFICGEGHACDSEIPLELMMEQMLKRYKKSNNIE